MPTQTIDQERDYDTELKMLDSQIFGLRSKRELALARRENVADLEARIATLERDKEATESEMRGARRLQQESRATERTDRRESARASARNDVNELRRISAAILSGAANIAHLAARSKVLESSIRRAAWGLIGEDAHGLSLPLLLEIELKALLADIARGQTPDQTQIAGLVERRAESVLSQLERAEGE